ncbi:MAG: hypothetical protein ACLQIB_04110 [Isosphaeraceae bacterium]
MERPSAFFRGSELPRLLILAAIMIGGWVLAWNYLQKRPEPAEAPPTVAGKPEPVVPDRSPEFESVTDRTPISLRDNAAYSVLLARAREKSPSDLAAASRRDIFLPHLWETPAQYRGVPVHLLGAARQVLRYPSKLTPKGWLYEAWIFTPDATRVPYVCVFEDAPQGLPIGTNISERVVFNGYFLKVMKYQAGDVPRGAPVLIGRIGWSPHEAAPGGGSDSALLHWSLAVIAALFLISLGRWIYQVRGLFVRPSRCDLLGPKSTQEEIEPAQLDAWVQSLAGGDEARE